ncbi:MAG: helix-turn-helix transcriptional regulator [Gemmatimonadales bacterium]|jgi:transcriptional regulator with XRE-family HTH domain
MGRESVSAVFARVLRREREAQRLSQEALAHRAGVHRTYVGLIERGLRKPTIEVGYALARALGTTLSELVKEAERRLQRGG